MPDANAPDLSGFRRRLRRIGRESPPLVARVLNRALGTARTHAARQTAKALGLPVGRIRRRLWPNKASRRSLSAALVASRRPLFVKGRQTKKGVTVGRGAAKQLYQRAWIHGQIALRRVGRERYPIEPIRTASVAVGWVPILTNVEGLALRTMRQTLDHELTRLGR